MKGVSCEFWSDFYEQCTLGTTYKVPFLRHDFVKKQWESVGRLLVSGWKKEKYFPIKLAPVIVDLIANFLQYVPNSERELFQQASCSFDLVDNKELLEALDMHNCRKVPKAGNFAMILHEIAHKELLQEPAFVIDQWSEILAPVASDFKDLHKKYDEMQPS